MQKAVRDALIGFMAAMAQAQAEATKEAQKAGIEHAKNNGAFRGRKPSFTRDQLKAVLVMLQSSEPVQSIAKNTGLSRATIYRIQSAPAKAFAVLDAWEL